MFAALGGYAMGTIIPPKLLLGKDAWRIEVYEKCQLLTPNGLQPVAI